MPPEFDFSPDKHFENEWRYAVTPSPISTMNLVNLKSTLSLSVKSQNLHSISVLDIQLCQLPQSPFMMILGLSKNPKDSDIVFFFFKK